MEGAEGVCGREEEEEDGDLEAGGLDPAGEEHADHHAEEVDDGQLRLSLGSDVSNVV